jgi:hypothetical protein
MSNIMPDLPTSAPITCQPWCEYGDGHTDEMPGEQMCSGIERRVLLHLAQKAKGGFPGHEPRWAHDFLTVYPEKLFGGEPTVFLGRGEAAGASLTLDEARQVATELLFAVTQIEEQL